jgi:hypothetical protein
MLEKTISTIRAVASSQNPDRHSNRRKISSQGAARERKSRVHQVAELSGFCSDRSLITIQNRDAQSELHVFSAKGTQCESPGQRPGKMRNECPKPPGGEMIIHPITPFLGFPVRNCRFLGRCPRLSHDAALRQDPSDTPSGVKEQKPDQQTTPIHSCAVHAVARGDHPCRFTTPAHHA